MGIQDLQSFIQNHLPNASQSIDLLKIGRSTALQRKQGGKGKGNNVKQQLSLVVDGECCLSRLYGGYFSDWACGGQWNRMVQFLATLVQTIHLSNVELVVVFNGSFEEERMEEWKTQQLEMHSKVSKVIRHVALKGTPPPKIWWVPPVCLRTCLRMALRHLNVSVICSMDDHHQEVIAYCRENGFDGLMAEDPEYAIFDPPHYFSSQGMKLTYKGSLETKELVISEVTKGLELPSDRMPIFAALLGNFMLTDENLNSFYKSLFPDRPLTQLSPEELIRAVAKFVRTLPSIDNVGAIGAQIFSASDTRVHQFKQCVQYYVNGTKDGFLSYNTAFSTGKHNTSHGRNKSKAAETKEGSHKFASETAEDERNSLAAYQEATACSNFTPQIVIEPATGTVENGEATPIASTEPHAVNGLTGPMVNLLISSSSSSSTESSNTASPSRQLPAKPVGVKNGDEIPRTVPKLSPEVIRTASERHQKGLMSPYVYQILTQAEVKFPVVMEDCDTIASPHIFFRPVRQMVYAILFNLHHQMYMANQNTENDKAEKKTPEVPIQVLEWVWTKTNQYAEPEIVNAEPVGWAVPTVQKLWFGSALDDKRRRLRAFLSCMRSDTQIMLIPNYVPQHMLAMACVLRYMMSFPDQCVLLKHELDAFLVQAFSPELMNALDLQDLQLPIITSRGIHLAAMFMQGIEMALLANDACGAPIPWLMCCPWLFFDGKLFHAKLHKAQTSKDLFDLCDHQVDQVVKVERMRKAILEGLEVNFASLPQRMPSFRNVTPPFGMMGPPPSHPPMFNEGRGRSLIGRRPVPQSGGKLQIAGVTVGSWGPNYGSSGFSRGRGTGLPLQIPSMGGASRGFYSPYMMSPGGRLPYPTNPTNRNTANNKPRGKKTQQSRDQTSSRKKSASNTPNMKKTSGKETENKGKEKEEETDTSPMALLGGTREATTSTPNHFAIAAPGQYDDADAIADNNTSPTDNALPTAVEIDG